jgi:PAS domain-containing protein
VKRHPYSKLPPHRYWRSAVADLPAGAVDPVVAGKFRIARDAPVFSAGSCFAQHIARQLKASGYHYLVAEPAHPLLPEAVAERYGYGLFSARTGNLYTTRQLVQLVQRAYGKFAPAEPSWRNRDGELVDPFRPAIQPGGFASEEELQADRAQHLRAVRAGFERMSVLVFTLGLTETWISRADGAAFPVCPGVSGGEFDARRYRLLNLGVAETLSDLEATERLLRRHNPDFRIVLTVSPVPLVATGEDRHVLTATTYSKSVLRVAAEEFCRARPHAAYFPSYEIITGNHARGAYFGPDLRGVTEAGVDHVMRLFLHHYGDGSAPAADAGPAADPAAVRSRAHLAEMERLVRAACEEEALGRDRH